MTGVYIMAAIPPHCREIRTRVEVVEWRGDRVLLRDLEIAPKLRAGSDYLIECDLGSFEADIPAELGMGPL